MSFHRLKVWPEFFSHLESRHKQFEIRKDDRGFQVGDTLLLCEWDPSPADSQGFKRAPKYTGKWIEATVVYLMKGGRFGLGPDYVIMGLGGMKDGRIPSEDPE